MTITPSNYLFNYDPHYKANQLICGYGQTAIITGWTVKESVARYLTSKEYAVIGNLYSPTRGISPLIRNLLANPHVASLVILQSTKEDQNAGGCQCLLDFLSKGFRAGVDHIGKDVWIINSNVLGYIDIDIPAEVLELIRESIVYREVESISKVVDHVKELNKKEKKKSWSNPLIFPFTETSSKIRPGTKYCHRIEGSTIAETWVRILHRIKTTGRVRPTEYGKWQELINIVAVVTDEPLDFYFPEPNYLPIRREFINDYISQILDDSPQREGIKYTYGQRLRSWFKKDQIQQVIDLLVSDINSSRAVMSLWDVNDYDNNDSPPCLNHIWIRTIDDELSLTATFRSNDMFSAWPSNAMGLRALQIHIMREIQNRINQKLKIGPLVTVSQSAHIYNDCWEYADKIVDAEYETICREKKYADPSGSYLIVIKNNQIFVEHITPGSGEIVNCYFGKSARKIYNKIAEDSPGIGIKHAMYLGSELQKAEICLKDKSYHYQQDKPLTVKS